MIELVKANPDVESLKLIVWIAGGLITLLLSSVAFFLAKLVNTQESLTKAVNTLTTTVTVLQSQNEDRHPVIVARLNDHAKRIDLHERDIAVLKTLIKNNEKTY